MKLLFVTPNLPFPPQAGSMLLAYHHIKDLASRHQIDLISFTRHSLPDTREMARWCGKITLIRDAPRWQIIAKAGIGLITGWPFAVSHYASRSAGRLIAREVAKGGYDVIVYQLTEMAQFLPRGYAGARVLSMEDPLALKNERWLPFTDSAARRLRARLEIFRIKRYERRHAPRFDRNLLINAADMAAYQRVIPSARFDWVPYGVDTSAFRPPPNGRAEGSKTVVISGTMSHPPNVDAVDFFCTAVWPLVRAGAPEARLQLVGAQPAPEVAKWSVRPEITVTGTVPDVKPYLQQAAVSVCAVRLRIGTQTKVLEAMACGTPVVTTSAGNNGVEAVSGRDLWVADTAADMGHRIISLLNGEGWRQMSENARKFVVERFDWAIGAARLDSILEQVKQHERA